MGRGAYAHARIFRLGPWLMAGALALALVDGVIALFLMGLLSGLRLRPRVPATAMLVLLLAGIPFNRPRADDAFLLKGALETHLAFAITRRLEHRRDEPRRARGPHAGAYRQDGLEPGMPIGLDMDRDELSLFPLIYWPVTASQRPLSPQTQSKVARYLKAGGMILFDTRDADQAAAIPGTATPATLALRRLLAGLDIPPLAPLAQPHVLTRSFYYLRDGEPGRFANGQVWVEAQMIPAATSLRRPNARSMTASPP